MAVHLGWAGCWLVLQGRLLLQLDEVISGVSQVDGHHAGGEGVGTLLDHADDSVRREQVHESREVLVPDLDVLSGGKKTRVVSGFGVQKVAFALYTILLG